GRARRREPESARRDERDGVLGASACGSTCLYPTSLGGGSPRTRSGRVHDGCRARSGRTRGRPLRRCAPGQAVAAGCAEDAALALLLSAVEPLGVAEQRELDDVPSEEEGRRPVDDDAELPRQER